MTEAFVILLLVLANGLFSGAEIAILTVRKTRVAELVETGRSGAETLQRLRADPEAFLATVQIGITVISAAAAAFGGASLAGPLAAALAGAGVPEHAASQVALGLVVVVVSFLSLVLGELVPKSLAMRFAEGYALMISPPLAGLARVGRPFVKLLTACSNLVLGLFGDRTSFAESRLSRDELQTLVEETAATGGLDATAGEIAARALDLHGLRVSAVMTPRPKVVALRLDAPPEEVARALREARFSRLPAYEGSLDNLRGYILVREALARLLETGSKGATPSGFPTAPSGEAPIGPLLREAPFVPAAAEVGEVLRQLQGARLPLAFVVDEQGSLAGLVTVEDLVEEVVGEILHETDSPHALVRREADGSFLVEGQAPLHEVNRELDLELPEEESYATVGGLVLERLGRIPRQGETLDLPEAGVRLEVVERSSRRIARVRLRRMAFESE